MFFKEHEDLPWDRIIDGIARGEYNLLVGAGFSLDALGGDGKPLPKSSELANDLLTQFGVPIQDEPSDLGFSYEFVEDRFDNDGRSRDKYLRDRFSNCTPSWHNIISQTYWKRIWTLNIDDVIENVYKNAPNGAGQRATPYNWDALYREPDRRVDELQIVHLHGFAPLLEPSKRNLVFSILEYLQAVSQKHAWHHVFGDLFAIDPFIIIGAKLKEEFDLAECIRRGNRSKELTAYPSLIILPQFSSMQRQQFEKYGLIPIEATANQFFSEVIPRVKSSPIPVFRGAHAADMSIRHRIFLQQFSWLRPDIKPWSGNKYDFYSGDEPQWLDIISELDARFEIVDRLSNRYVDATKERSEKSQKIYCIWGPAGSGKSTALLRIGRELNRRSYDIFAFRGEEQLDVDAALSWLKYDHQSVFLVDGIADFCFSFGKLAEKCRDQNIELILFATEREQRLRFVFEGIDVDYLDAGDDCKLSRLSDVDIDRLIAKLESAHRLGSLTRKSSFDRVNHFKQISNRQLLVGLYELEGGKQFSERLVTEYANIKDNYVKNIYALTCMTYAFGYSLPIEVACLATGVSPSKFVTQLSTNHLIDGVMRLEEKRLRPRHRVIANVIVHDCLSFTERYQLSQSLAKSLAPYVNKQTIKQRTKYYLIARIFLDSDIICHWVGKSKAGDWYDGLEDEYGWNARYWEQRALAEMKNRRFPHAISYAEEALKRLEDSFTLTTLSTIQLHMSTEYYSIGSTESFDFYWRGVRNLRAAAKLDYGRFEHPYISFFTRTLALARDLLENGKEVDSAIIREWQNWNRDAKRAPVFQHPQYFRQLSDFHAQWLNLLATS